MTKKNGSGDRNSRLIPVPFHGDQISLVEYQGEPYVPAKPICEKFSLSWSSQLQKLNSNPRRWSVSIIDTVAEDSKNRAMTCIPLWRVAGWLNSINPKKVKNLSLRKKLITYQEESDRVLFDYWMRRHETSQRPALPKGHLAVPEQKYRRLLARSAGLTEHTRAPQRHGPFTDEELLQALELRSDGLSFAEIGAKLNRASSTISQYVSAEVRKELGGASLTALS